MNHDPSWFARLGIDQGLFTGTQCAQIRRKLGGEAELMAFAQEVIDSGTVTDVEILERLARLALKNRVNLMFHKNGAAGAARASITNRVLKARIT